jgi:cytochrome c oxidase subunit II
MLLKISLISNIFFEKINDICFLNTCYGDVARPWQMRIQDPATPMMEGIINFHNFLLCIVVAIGVGVTFLLAVTLLNFNNKKNLNPAKFAHANTLEIVWTVIPALILLYIAGPSFTLLYALDEPIRHSMVIKVVGSQWFWMYYVPFLDPTQAIYEEAAGFKFKAKYSHRLLYYRVLDVARVLYLPIYTYVTFLITATDVIHSWAVPSFGIKLDACPGRLAHVSTIILREGVFYGQCSEMCGFAHGFMPIVIEVLNEELYLMVQYFHDFFH